MTLPRGTGPASMPRADILALAVLFLAPLVALWQILDPAHGLAGADWTNLTYPYYRFCRNVFLSEGRLPFWNPWVFCGMPFLASLNVISLYPTELLSLPFNLTPSVFFALDTVFHLGWAGAGTYLLLRRAGRAPAAAFTGALCFEFGQRLFGLTSMGIFMIRSIAWLPWLFLALESFREERRFRWAFAAGAAIALPVLTAGMQFAALAGPVAAAWLVVRHPGRGAAATAVIAGTSLALSAVLLLPGLEYSPVSVRANPEFYAVPLAQMWAVPLPELLTFLVPELFGWGEAYFGPRSLPPPPSYFGLLPLVLALAGLASAPARDKRWSILAAAGALLALGPNTPVGLFVSRLPVYSGFRGAERWLMFTLLGVAWFAARGWELIASGPRRPRLALALSCLLLLLSGACGLALLRADAIASRIESGASAHEHVAEGRIDSPGIHRAVRFAFSRSARSALLGAGTLALAGAASVPLPVAAGAAWLCMAHDLLTTGYLNIKTGRDDPGPAEVSGEITRRAGNRLPPVRVHSEEWLMLMNRRMDQGISWTWGMHGLPLTRSVMQRLLVTSAPPLGNPAALALTGARFAVAPGAGRAGWKPLGTVRNEEGRTVRLFAVPGGLPPAFLADEAVPRRGVNQVLDTIRQPDWTPRRLPVELPPGESLPARLNGRGRVDLEWGRDEIRAAVSAEGDALLVLTETWYPAWKAFVDGRRTPILRAGLNLRALLLSPGKHEVRMVYDSWLFKAGLWLTLLSAAALLLLGGTKLADRGPSGNPAISRA